MVACGDSFILPVAVPPPATAIAAKAVVVLPVVARLALILALILAPILAPVPARPPRPVL
jgi:hypothetical protein